MNEYTYETAQKVLGIYAICLIIIGTTTSLISFVLCSKLSKTPTFVFMAFLSLSDIISLYFWNLTIFIDGWLDMDFLNSSYSLCKLGSYYQFTSLQISAWLLILISFEHNLSVRIKHWRSLYFNTKKAFAAAFGLVAFFLVLNSCILVRFGYEVKANNTNMVFCFYSSNYPDTYFMKQWGQAQLFLYSIIPFILLFISNILLILRVKKSIKTHSTMKQNFSIINTNVAETNISNRKHQANKNPERSFALTILFLNISFFLITLPDAFISFYFDPLFETLNGRIVIAVCTCVSFSFHGLNFFIYYASNKKFRNEFRKLYLRLKNLKNQNQS